MTRKTNKVKMKRRRPSTIKSLRQVLFDIHHMVWFKSAILQKVQQQTEGHGQRSFLWAGVIQQMFQQLTPQQLALQALQQQHPRSREEISGKRGIEGHGRKSRER